MPFDLTVRGLRLQIDESADPGQQPELGFRTISAAAGAWTLGFVRGAAESGFGGALSFSTNPGGAAPADTAVERMRIARDGNVGIGAPPDAAYRLNVGGALNATAVHVNGSPLVSSPWASAAGGLTLADSVGIGAPLDAAYRLNVGGALNATEFHVNGSPLVSSPWASAAGGLTFADSVGIGAPLDAAYRLNVGGALNATEFHVNGSPLVASQWQSVAGGLTFADSVGIGTAAPQGKLDVQGDIRAGDSSLYFTKTDHNHSGIGNNTGWAAIENAADFDALMILGRAGTAKGRNVRLWDYLQVNGSMDVTGNLGVGTAAPSHPLHVNSTLGLRQNALYLSGAPGWSSFTYNAHHNAANTQWVFPNPTRTAATVEMDDALGFARFDVWTTTTAAKSAWALRLRVDGDTGNLGIGTGGPAVRLHVVGNRIRLDSGAGRSLDMRADGGALDLESNGGPLFINNNGATVNIRNLVRASSRELKQDIAALDAQAAGDALAGLTPVSFRFKDAPQGRPHLGFIAEETPAAIATEDRRAIDSMHIIAVLTRVVQEQQRVLRAVQRRLNLDTI